MWDKRLSTARGRHSHISRCPASAPEPHHQHMFRHTWSTGENSTAHTPRRWPRHVATGTRSGSRHTFAVLSCEPVASTLSFGATDTALMSLSWATTAAVTRSAGGARRTARASAPPSVAAASGAADEGVDADATAGAASHTLSSLSAPTDAMNAGLPARRRRQQPDVRVRAGRVRGLWVVRGGGGWVLERSRPEGPIPLELDAWTR
eukprot:354001-Chlamydomonas_euryale.AAC.3